MRILEFSYTNRLLNKTLQDPHDKWSVYTKQHSHKMPGSKIKLCAVCTWLELLSTETACSQPTWCCNKVDDICLIRTDTVRHFKHCILRCFEELSELFLKCGMSRVEKLEHISLGKLYWSLSSRQFSFFQNRLALSRVITSAPPLLIHKLNWKLHSVYWSTNIYFHDDPEWNSMSFLWQICIWETITWFKCSHESSSKKTCRICHGEVT